MSYSSKEKAYMKKHSGRLPIFSSSSSLKGKGYHLHPTEHSINRMKGYKTPKQTISKLRRNLYTAQHDITYNFPKKRRERFSYHAETPYGEEIRYNLWDENNKSYSEELPNYELERIGKEISEGYTSGQIYYSDDDKELTGWWSI